MKRWLWMAGTAAALIAGQNLHAVPVQHSMSTIQPVTYSRLNPSAPGSGNLKTTGAGKTSSGNGEATRLLSGITQSGTAPSHLVSTHYAPTPIISRPTKPTPPTTSSSSGNAATPVPDGGATVILLGAGLVGTAMMRRKFGGA
jgi:hypothetical protein